MNKNQWNGLCFRAINEQRRGCIEILPVLVTSGSADGVLLDPSLQQCKHSQRKLYLPCTQFYSHGKIWAKKLDVVSKLFTKFYVTSHSNSALYFVTYAPPKFQTLPSVWERHFYITIISVSLVFYYKTLTEMRNWSYWVSSTIYLHIMLTKPAYNTKNPTMLSLQKYFTTR